MLRSTAAEGRREPEFACTVDVTLSVIGGKWKLLIYYQLRRGTARFGQLKRAMPRITQTMLTQQLRELEEDGIVSRTVYAEVPPRVEYALTEFGRTLDPVIGAMCEWGGRYRAMVVERKRVGRGDSDGAAGDDPVAASDCPESAA